MRFLVLLLFLCFSLQAWADQYRIDPVHTSAYFAVDHLGFSLQSGRFDRISGTLDIDEEKQAGHVMVEIDAKSLSSADEARDKRLKGSSFFNVEQFPTIVFVGNHFIWQEGRLTAVEGELTLLGVARPVMLQVVRFKCGFHLFDLARACGADAKTTIKRSDFGMDSWLSSIGDEVQITLRVEAIHE